MKVEELWKPVPGYEGSYEVSNCGRVRGLNRWDAAGRRWKGRMRKCQTSWNGYPVIGLRDGRLRLLKVHRVVLEAFVGPCPEGMEACHFPDRNPANCHLDNLRWDTKKENEFHKVKHGTAGRGEQHPRAKLNNIDIERIFDLRRAGRQLKHIAGWMGISVSQTSKILARQMWAHLPL